MSIFATEPIGVLVVDHHRCLLWGLARLIESARPRLELAGLATCHSEALSAMEKHRPNVVLLDLDLGSESGFDLLPQPCDVHIHGSGHACALVSPDFLQ